MRDLRPVKTCLIVDDSRVVRQLARGIFEDIGYRCEEAENGQDALDLCHTSTPDVILLDWNMPVMDGLSFLKAFRSAEKNADTKVIFCTTENDMTHIKAAMDGGANEYIMKPFDHEIIRIKLMNA